MALTGGFLPGEVIQFSDNLNCFIGGRGTGKSTATRALAYALGVNEKFGEAGNCPDSIVVYCEDADGVRYGYKRTKGGDIIVKAKEDENVTDVPIDSFRIEYYDQGELADVAKDPLNSPQLFQAFLDRHTKLRDLLESETDLLGQLRQNGAHLIQLEGRFQQLKEKKDALKDIDTKLKIAEDGKLKDIVALQSQIASERTLREAIEGVVKVYNTGVNLSSHERDFDKLVESAGALTADETSVTLLSNVRVELDAARTYLGEQAKDINKQLKDRARALTGYCNELKENHARLNTELAPKIAELREKGLAGNLLEIEHLLRQKEALGKEIAAIEQKEQELKSYRKERLGLLDALTQVRDQMTTRRKALLASVNSNLSQSLQDYTVFVSYDSEGIIDEFLAFIQMKMSGSYFNEQNARQLCRNVLPADLATWVRNRQVEELERASALRVNGAHRS
jgi:chromosome segregation ATPase